MKRRNFLAAAPAIAAVPAVAAPVVQMHENDVAPVPTAYVEGMQIEVKTAHCKRRFCLLRDSGV